MSALNMTPLIDVMLVLLIVFMITAPMMTMGVEVNLPSANAPMVKDSTDPLVISINHAGEVFLQDHRIAMENLHPRLKDILAHNPELKVFIRGDHRLNYGAIMHVVSIINSVGINKIAFITQSKEKK